MPSNLEKGTTLQIRDIAEADLGAVVTLLAEGFPRRPAAYWQRALTILATRPAVGDLTRFGYILETEGTIDGVILVISSKVGDTVRRNLSSWYVRERSRGSAVFLFKRAIRERNCTYLNLSPSETARPIALALGFRAYTAGTLLLDTRAAVLLGGLVIRPLAPGDRAALPEAEQEMIDRHLSCGCAGLVLGEGEIALYRRGRLKGLVPSAQFVQGRPATLLAAAPGLMRALAIRGIPVALVDMPLGISQETPLPFWARTFPERAVRFAKGLDWPEAGDLRDTEIALFGP